MKYVKVMPTEEVVSQYRSVDSDVKIKPYKEDKQPFIPKRKVWKGLLKKILLLNLNMRHRD